MSRLLIIAFVILHAFASFAAAEVVFFDTAIAHGKSGTLKALTKGMIFPEGGKLVEFNADGRQIGRTLSGGDGYAYIRYTPASKGIKKIQVASDSESDDGTVIVMGKRDRLILIEIESTLFSRPFSFEPLNDGKEALKELSNKFVIIYLAGIMDMKKSRNWLRQNGFPLFPVFPPGSADISSTLKEEGIAVYATIASADMLSRTLHTERKFSFEESEEGTAVKDWKELLKKLE